MNSLHYGFITLDLVFSRFFFAFDFFSISCCVGFLFICSSFVSLLLTSL